MCAWRAEGDERSVKSKSTWPGLHLQDELLALILSKLGDTIVLAAGVRNDLLAASQVLSSLTQCVTRVVHKQAHESPACRSALVCGG